MTDLREPYACIQVHIEDAEMLVQDLAIQIERLKAEQKAVAVWRRNLIHALSEQKKRDKEMESLRYSEKSEQ